MVSLLALMILSGFLMIVKGPLGLAVFFLVVSIICMVVVTYLAVHNYYKVMAARKHVRLRMSNYFSAKQTRRKAVLLVQLLIIMWYYLIVWLLATTKAIDKEYTYAAYMLGSIFGKVIFSSLVIESHVTLLYEYLVTTAKHSNLRTDDDLDLLSGNSGSHRQDMQQRTDNNNNSNIASPRETVNNNELSTSASVTAAPVVSYEYV